MEDKILALKLEAKTVGMKVSIARRKNNRVYATIDYSKSDKDAVADLNSRVQVNVSGWSDNMRLARYFVNKHFPNARMTSGGSFGSSTYLISEEK